MVVFSTLRVFPRLPAIPRQAHTIAPVRRLQCDAVYLSPFIHGDPHRTAQAPVVGHHVRLPPPAFAGQNLPREGQRPSPSVGAEPDRQLAPAVDLDGYLAQTHLPKRVHGRRAASVTVET